MKLRLSTVGINTSSFPPILVTDTGVQVMATIEMVRRAKVETQQLLKELEFIESGFMSNSTIEPHQSPDEQAGNHSCSPDTASSVTKSTPKLQ